MDNYTNFDPLSRGMARKKPNGDFSIFEDRLDSFDSFQPKPQPTFQRQAQPFDKSERAAGRAARTYFSVGKKVSSFIRPTAAQKVAKFNAAMRQRKLEEKASQLMSPKQIEKAKEVYSRKTIYD